MMGARVMRTRTESDGREVITEIFQVPGMNGGFETSMQITTETTRIGPDSMRIKREVLGNSSQGPFGLIEISETTQQTFPDGTARSITDTWTPDGGGYLNLASRQVEQKKSVDADAQQTETVLYAPGMNGALDGAERVFIEERRLDSNRVQTNSRHDFRDGNGGWQTVEKRKHESRMISVAEVVEEESVQQVDSDGNLALTERTTTRRSRTPDADRVVTEVYSPYVPGIAREPGSPPVLSQRVSVTTTPLANGGSQTITETEAQDPSVSTGPIRVISRIVEILQQIRPGIWETRRQTYALDGSGRLTLISGEEGNETRN
jgi:hypothetical protein